MNDKVEFFSAWEVHTKGIRSLIQISSTLDNDLEVWRGADGSYAVGDITDFDTDLDTDLWLYAGTVGEYF